MPVYFQPEGHKYFNENGAEYISVTTLIKRYTPPFDGEKWSSYKAVKDILSKYKVFAAYKEKAGGWEYVVDYCRAMGDKFPYTEEVIKRKLEYLEEWEENRTISAAKGTEFHKRAEGETKQNRILTEDMRELALLNGVDLLAIQNFKSSGIYTEILLYDDEFAVAGQSDYVLKEGKYFSIKDYKTSKKIEKEGFMGETMYPPVNNLPNSNFHKFELQLSIYALILERKGYIPRKLMIEKVYDDDRREPIPVEYKREEAYKVLRDHLDKSRKENREKVKLSLEKGQSRAPIFFSK